VNTLSHLELSSKAPQKPAQKPKSAPVAESWDEEISSGSDAETESTQLSSVSPESKSSRTKDYESLALLSTKASVDLPNPPPPTPASPVPFEFPNSVPYGGGARDSTSSGSASPARRPEKTTAVAGRLIAGALGVRAARRTEEEREFDRVMREKVRKRRDEERKREKEEKEAAEERKRSVWED